MRKHSELCQPSSCLNRAKTDELIFVILGRDIAAQRAIAAWVEARVDLGKNKPNDIQIVEALECAAAMERER